jgi:UDPglucose--hexose-1-phosphate uridylyltransferase
MANFPQLRKDPVVDRWVMIAPERAGRPFDLAEPGRLRAAGPCPFCEGEEHRTPPEVLAFRSAESKPNERGWRLRVVPNIFPAARQNVDANACGNFFRTAVGYGVHEVVVESPEHESSLTALSQDQVRSVFRAYQARLADLASDPRLQYVQIFKNHGAGAGASVEHVHSQILGLSLVPREIEAELTASERYHNECGRCVFCDLLEHETRSRERVIIGGEYVMAIAAFAGRFPYESWLVPRKHRSDFQTAPAAELNEVADLTREILSRLGRWIENVSYNLVLHTAPLHGGPRPDYHWHWELLPRTTGIAGFELATGCFLNPLPPEIAAERLRG